MENTESFVRSPGCKPELNRVVMPRDLVDQEAPMSMPDFVRLLKSLRGQDVVTNADGEFDRLAGMVVGRAEGAPLDNVSGAGGTELSPSGNRLVLVSEFPPNLRRRDYGLSGSQVFESVDSLKRQLKNAERNVAIASPTIESRPDILNGIVGDIRRYISSLDNHLLSFLLSGHGDADDDHEIALMFQFRRNSTVARFEKGKLLRTFLTGEFTEKDDLRKRYPALNSQDPSSSLYFHLNAGQRPLSGLGLAEVRCLDNGRGITPTSSRGEWLEEKFAPAVANELAQTPTSGFACKDDCFSVKNAFQGVRANVVSASVADCSLHLCVAFPNQGYAAQVFNVGMDG
ncbi:MAG: hypothetical protein WC897_02835 [Candidatus Gracilibacteria bacterium]